jgi:hypothetical protein
MYEYVGSNPASATKKNGLPMRFKPFYFFAYKGQNLQVDAYGNRFTELNLM